MEHARVEPGRSIARGDQHLTSPIRVEGDPDGVALTASDRDRLPGHGVVLAQVQSVSCGGEEPPRLRHIRAYLVYIDVDALVHLRPTLAPIAGQQHAAHLDADQHALRVVRQKVNGTHVWLMRRGRDVPRRAGW